MKNFVWRISGIYLYTIIFLITISLTGCNCYSIVEADVSIGDSDDGGCGSDGGYQDDPDYPTRPDDDSTNDVNNDGGCDIILIGYWKVNLSPNNSLGSLIINPLPNEVKYYEIQLSNDKDFSGPVQKYKLHSSHFKPLNFSASSKYYRVRAVYTNSSTEWSNVVTFQ